MILCIPPTLTEDQTNVTSVTKPSLTAQTLPDIRESTQERNYINGIYVVKSLVEIHTLWVIRKVML